MRKIGARIDQIAEKKKMSTWPKYYSGKDFRDVLSYCELPPPDLYQRIFLTLKARDIETGELLLDLGGGFGIYSLEFAEKGANVILADVSHYALRNAKKIFQHFGVECSLVVCDGCSLPFRSDTFDSVYCLEVLEHVHDDLTMLKEINRVLRKSSEFVLSVPNMDFPLLWDPEKYILLRKRGLSLKEINTIGSHWPGIGPFLSHFSIYSYKELRQKCTKAGLWCVRRYTCGYYILTTILMLLKFAFILRPLHESRQNIATLRSSTSVRALARVSYASLRVETLLTKRGREGATLFVIGNKP